MGLSTATAGDILKLYLNATAIANVADNAGSGPLTNVYVSLHTADPGVGGNQSTSEVTYTSYARVPVARTTGGWAVTNNQAVPVAQIQFPAGTGGSGTATYACIGTAASGAGKIVASGAISPSIVTGNGVTPILQVAGTTFTLT
jgi:hypothetical protein